MLESLLDNGLFLGAIVQLLCILAVIIPTSNWYEQELMCLLSVTGTVRLSLFYLQEETEPKKTKKVEVETEPKETKKSKGHVPEICQKLKKETKKKVVSLSE
ncbi:protein MANBAL [Oncorhynchus nerka]|uniref:protein MANBAL n=1 Tax=Oncorhynchus nerka TaxID=8023 RepID=UPI0031B7EBCB